MPPVKSFNSCPSSSLIWLTSVSFMYVCVAGNGEMLFFFPCFFAPFPKHIPFCRQLPLEENLTIEVSWKRSFPWTAKDPFLFSFRQQKSGLKCWWKQSYCRLKHISYIVKSLYRLDLSTLFFLFLFWCLCHSKF